MSNSSIYGIRKDYTGEEICEYKNAWWFSPVIWNVLSDKILPRYFMAMIQTVTGIDGAHVWEKINDNMNHSDNTADRVCWELSNQQIFHTADQQVIANAILDFIKQNDMYGKSVEDNISILQREHIIERFTSIANDILSINKDEFPYFVFKNTSADNNVEKWFEKYDDKTDEYIPCSLLDQTDTVYTEFVFFKDDKIDKFVSNQDFDITKIY